MFKVVLLIWILFYSGGANAGAVAAAEPMATQAGIAILKKGGNAFDAAVAVSAMLAVVEPASSGLGGGGFYLLHDAKANKDIMLDARERAPLVASRDMYLDENGEIIKRASVDGALAAGIPGLPAALVHLAENYGALPLATSLQPAIKRARRGFHANQRYIQRVKFRLNAIKASPAAAAIFLDDGEVPAEDYLIVQQDLAATLQAIASNGRAGFYSGTVADKLVSSVRAGGGIWELKDLTEYKIKMRAPIISHYGDMKIISAPPPSSGGLVMAQAFNLLRGFDLSVADKSDADFVHLAAEAMRLAYQDRARYMGDTDFVKVPIKKLTSAKYADSRRRFIKPKRATASQDLTDATKKYSSSGTDTTHFSIIDRYGNRVAATLSINYPFGSGMVAAGTGVLLNDEMDDFSAKPGVPNVYGLVGGYANAIAGGKRMLSSMTPTFLQKDGRIAVLGSPGGSRIISMVMLAALEFYRGGSAQAMVSAPRFHHQYLPDTIEFEKDTLRQDVINELKSRGHRMTMKNQWGNMQVVIQKDGGGMSAASDPRGRGVAVVLR